VKCWGANVSGILGDGTTTARDTPVTVSGLGSGVASIDVSAWHSCAVTAAGAVKCWGDNGAGRLGNGTTNDSSVPVATTGLGAGVAQIALGSDGGCVRTNSGEVRCWGGGGLLGRGPNIDFVTTPLVVPGFERGVTSIAAGNGSACATSAVIGARCWGANGYGQLGDGTRESTFVPVAVKGFG
jgi:alpha-tubulin suppressor-like RCC1 family protein